MNSLPVAMGSVRSSRIIAASTGYRRGEISSLTLSSFAFDATPPHVTVEASYSKRRKKDVQVLPVEVVEKIRQWLELRVPEHESLLFPLTKETCGTDRGTSKMMKRDLQTARDAWIAEVDADDTEERERREASDYLTCENAAGLGEVDDLRYASSGIGCFARTVANILTSNTTGYGWHGCGRPGDRRRWSILIN